jgi:hypothetical protein
VWADRFDPKQRTVWLDVLLSGPAGNGWCTFVLDTGSPVTILDPGKADELGYSARMGKRLRSFWAVGGTQPGYLLEVVRLATMGFVVERCELVCQDLPRRMAVDGLIGMDLLEGRIVTLDGIRGLLTVGS